MIVIVAVFCVQNAKLSSGGAHLHRRWYVVGYECNVTFAIRQFEIIKNLKVLVVHPVRGLACFLAACRLRTAGMALHWLLR